VFDLEESTLEAYTVELSDGPHVEAPGCAAATVDAPRFEIAERAAAVVSDSDEFMVMWPSQAVQREIAALERITQETPVVAPIRQPSEFDDRNAPVVPAPPAFAGFAPPTIDVSVEAIYARAAAQMEADAAEWDAWEHDGILENAVYASSADDANKRTSTLHRLIGGLRRKDR